MDELGHMTVIQFVGYSNSGKTTMLASVIPLLRATGLRIGVIKHDGHDFEMDHEGKDTWKYREAGADIVAIQSAAKTAWIEQQSVPLDQLVKRMAGAGTQLVLVEGFKREHFPKLVFLRRPEDRELLRQVSDVIAIVTWEAAGRIEDRYTRFSIDDAAEIADFLIQQMKKP
ncbi:molybdopterin-guanine dinucleotide biosynthesis protein B [Brevibacillus migulae]|uniref:molybdopterin-guanine dinucleotide biosynthesis protein B n=1 Tax=Brevibacillus migulae TaxID=1644114 RepID=UPI001F437BA5|nr:molybdopterin-guanine dinucleotide biosynthesis protein B [Brevibacillus migulae]